MTRKYLKQNGLRVVPFDKGTGICLMRVETYKDKMLDILNCGQFEKVEKKREK